MKILRPVRLAAAIVLLSAASAAAEEAPKFFSETYPEHALDSAMAWYGTLQNDEAALEPKTRELIALGVAAQIPCDYCVYAHAKGARAAGASEAELREAVATAGAIRNWSTVLNGMAYDVEAFKAEFDKISVPSN